MKNYLKDFNSFSINEMASTLSKLGLPKKLIRVIHSLPDTIEKISPFAYATARQRGAELPPIGGNRPSHEVEIIEHFRMRKTQLLGNQYGTYPAKQPGWLAEKPWGDHSILLAVPEPGGKYAGEDPRYDYIYNKESAFDDRGAGRGKKYRVITMGKDGKILRDWAAFQGKITYPANPETGERMYRNDFKDYPTAADGKIDVYVLDTETVGTEREKRQLGPGKGFDWHDVPIGKARAKKRERVKSRQVTAYTFIDDFAERFEKILSSIFGKRKKQAAEKYASLILQDDADPTELANLSKVIHEEPNVMDNIIKYYEKFLKYLKLNGDYGHASQKELHDAMYVRNMEELASIEDIVKVHGKMKALKNFAEFILTGDVNDINKEMEKAIEEPGAQMRDDFEDMLDFDFDMDNPAPYNPNEEDDEIDI
mgnify:CR=1 FL=1|tara:strand:- start:7522 stop:8793 length:1272 start_codon:yes stop_codon:yes gene_type:complete